MPKLPSSIPGLPEGVTVADIQRAITEQSLTPIIEAACFGKFPDKSGFGYKGCLMVAKADVQQRCADKAALVEEACQKLGGFCRINHMRNIVEKLVDYCDKLTY
jgi:hypothetical protein